MHLKRFKPFGQHIEFDELTGNAFVREKSDDIASNPVLGICDLKLDNWLALYVEKGALTLQHGKVKIDLDVPGTTLDYAHLDSGVTQFQVSRRGLLNLSLTYPSWWTHTQFVAGLGSGPDDENDFCAYLKFMMDSEATRKHLMSMYSGK